MACKLVLQYTRFWEDLYLADEMFERNQKTSYKKNEKYVYSPKKFPWLNQA